MAAPNWGYVALHPINFNGVRAFNPGDLVPDEQVHTDDNQAGRLVVGEDVQTREQWQAALDTAVAEQAGPVDVAQVAEHVAVEASRPAANARKAEWVAYAAEHGDMTAEEAEKLTIGQLAEMFTSPDNAPADEAADVEPQE